MVVSLTLDQLGHAMRLAVAPQSLGPEYVEEVQRLLDTAKAIVEERAPDAPEPTQNQAVIQVCAYVFDSQPAGRRRFAALSAFMNSGAADLVSHWVDRSGEVVG